MVIRDEGAQRHEVWGYQVIVADPCKHEYRLLSLARNRSRAVFYCIRCLAMKTKAIAGGDL